jgi:hypothetical protein
METKTVKAFGTEAPDANLKELTIDRRTVLPKDVEIDILFLWGLSFRSSFCSERLGNDTVPGGTWS